MLHTADSAWLRRGPTAQATARRLSDMCGRSPGAQQFLPGAGA